MEIAVSLISFILVLAGFLYGAVKILFPKKPLFLKLMVLSAGCYALSLLSDFVNLLTGGYEYFITLGIFGLFGTVMFQFSANFGTMDKIMDDGKNTKTVRLVSLLAPALAAAVMVFITFSALPYGILTAVILWVLLGPILPASYFVLKHVLLPNDSFGFVAMLRPGNLCSLVFYGAVLGSVLAATKDPEASQAVFSLLAAFAMAGVAFFTVQGEKQWKI